MADVFDGVNINKLNGQLGESSPSDDNVVIMTYSIATLDLPAGIAHNTAYQLRQPQDAITLGFTAAYDANEHLYVLGTISEVFAYAPGVVVWLIPVITGKKPSEILALAGVKAAIRVAASAKGIAICGTAETAVELFADVEAVQAQIAAFAAEHRLIDFVLVQGNNGVAEDSWAIADLEDMREKVAPNVSVSIGQDPFVATQDAAYAKQADMGCTLGMIMVRKVNENLGSVNILVKPDAYKANPNYTLSRANRWQAANLANGVSVSTLTAADQTALTNKGYIFAGQYSGYAGFFFNDSPTCVEATSDYNRIENNRTWNKAARLIRLALMPQVKGVVKKDPTTGFIKSTVIGGWIGLCNKALETMKSADEISGYAVSIAANQIPNAQTPLKVKAQVTKDGIVHSFEVDLGF
jgi:hypothetical protein